MTSRIISRRKAPLWSVGLVLWTVCALGGCSLEPQSVTREELTGTYAYVNQDPERRVSDHDLNRLTLMSDGEYELVEGGTTRAVTQKRGTWRLGRDPLEISLDDSMYPVLITRHEIRLLYDLDTGVWWVKERQQSR
jgi:hypothetical protein